MNVHDATTERITDCPPHCLHDDGAGAMECCGPCGYSEPVTNDYADLRALAEAATPGPWGYRFPGKNRITTPVDIDVTEADWGGENLREYWLCCTDDRNAWRAADAEFIAAANPARILALLADLDEARRAVWASEEIDRRAGMLAGVQAERDALAAKVEAVRALCDDPGEHTPRCSIATSDVCNCYIAHVRRALDGTP